MEMFEADLLALSLIDEKLRLFPNEVFVSQSGFE